MSKAVRDHLRSNVVGYIAIFLFATSGTAIALDGTNTVFADDIVNGEVGSADILDGSISNGDLRNGAVDSAKVKNNTVEGGDVLDDSLGAADIGTNGVDDDEVAPLNGDANIDDETLTTFDIQTNAVQTDEIQDGTIRKADIGDGEVGAAELGDAVITRLGTAVNVPGGAAQNGAYDVATSSVSCSPGEELVGGSGQWSPDDNAGNNYELWIAEVRLNTSSESVVVDGGNDSGVDHSIVAVALCLQA